jgi:hypothetical protein
VESIRRWWDMIGKERYAGSLFNRLCERVQVIPV